MQHRTELSHLGTEKAMKIVGIYTCKACTRKWEKGQTCSLRLLKLQGGKCRHLVRKHDPKGTPTGLN